MTFFILTLFQTGYKLRISTLHHLLTGKRTSSVLLHGFFYKNLAYLGALPDLTAAVFQKAIQELAQKELIVIEEGFGYLTAQGAEYLARQRIDLQGINNLRYGRMREEVWQLLLFAVQVVSQLSFSEKNYLPIENRPYYLQLIKTWLAHSDPGLTERFPEELVQIFSQLPTEVANFLANQFSGYHQQGKTTFQLLPENFRVEPWDQLYRQRAIDLFLAQIKEGELSRLLAPLDQQNLNQSMLKTREYFLADKTIEEILRLRHLKPGTINDHFIEWALLDEAFPFDHFERVDFAGLTEAQVIGLHYQDYSVSYLNFRLSQIYYLREQSWN
ncbi:helix-turn-helix domain-containing protein [Enterococcus pseudoavium]|uniref:helix-turn-helix domain-containing protein n=1 Tax=Enterococcus pseudoavium TaxID=44007 RepID=UPI0028922339|nr:helix-turn-helix domain-containing protein [Enterococcus pseudoavium]MDT2753826.1 helix-turn-helix domain-containing protein [Enterococcus pseudoavium]